MKVLPLRWKILQEELNIHLKDCKKNGILEWVFDMQICYTNRCYSLMTACSLFTLNVQMISNWEALRVYGLVLILFLTKKKWKSFSLCILCLLWQMTNNVANNSEVKQPWERENVLEKKIVHFLNHCYNNPACPSWPNRQVGIRDSNWV